MAMSRKTRTVWIIVGTALTLVTVGAIAFGIWSAGTTTGTRTPFDHHFDHPGSYDSSLVSEHSTATTTTVYTISTPVVIVDVQGPVAIRVNRGDPGRLSIHREMTWNRQVPEVFQSWDEGKILRIRFTCAGPRAGADLTCSADYTLTVPPDVKVMLAGPNTTRECPLTTTETLCRPAR